MPTILMFHHVLGLTPGVTAFAHALSANGHTVHTPDLFDGKTFASIPSGLAHVKSIGFSEIIARGTAVANGISGEIVTMGMSLGVLPAQAIAQTRANVRGAVLLHGAITISEFSPTWPSHVSVQIHAMDGDPEFVASGDIEAARGLVAEAENGALFLYPGSGHLFTDNGLADYDAEASALLMTRVKDFLALI
ncbi:MAG: dienelactone hydrolase family protein [Candidatus Devosia phytovorans]|uniref:Dienelactone hydrolase family protein n=1 Tax=Candidatus Devosia phytovorans TaxID=3121372 RepID=A0AAJ5VU93_9HYPH|nr:dienelactone hydrolase family protein [Devosia sp.]WEK04261.1 MAG: dienelactone hydrolase family protein [Devosia sp.]